MSNSLKLNYSDRVQKIVSGELTDLASVAFTAVEINCFDSGDFFNGEEITRKHSRKRAGIRIDDTYLLTVLPKNNISLVKLTGEDLETNISYLLEAIWIPNGNIGGWQMNKKNVRSLDQIKDFIDRLTVEKHKIELILPWKDDLEDFHENYFEYEEDLDDFVKFVMGITNDEITFHGDNFKLEICDQLENFGPDCEYYRFEKMIKELTAKTNWAYTYGDWANNIGVVSGNEVDWNEAKESDPDLLNRPFLDVSAIQGGLIAPTGEFVMVAEAHNASKEDLRLLHDYLLKFSITWENLGKEEWFYLGDPEAMRWDFWYEERS